jgi:hypothetical protein
MAKKRKIKRRIHKKYSYFERVLMLLPKLSAAECLLARDAIEEPTGQHIAYMRDSLKYRHWRSYKRTLNPDKRVKIYEEPYLGWAYGRWVNDEFQPIDEDELKKHILAPMVISDTPITADKSNG